MAEAQTKTAEEMAKEQKQISVSEFFQKNRHLLGYDNKIKALLIIVKEAVDNSLDACEEAGILPDLYIKIEELDKEKYKIVVRDNGPGVVKKQIPRIFGTLLYGSKFHRLRQSRGQQGLGVSCAVLYAQITTGEPTEIVSSIGDGVTHRYKLKIDVKKNEPAIVSEETENGRQWHGVQLTFVAEGIYREHKQSVLEYLKQIATSHPYASITFDAPTGRQEFKRVIEQLPVQPKEIRPHLYGVEVGILARMLQETTTRTLATFFTGEFSRVGSGTAKEICQQAEVDPNISPRKVSDEQIVRLVNIIKETKLTRPPTDCLSPMGQDIIEKGIKKELDPEFIAAISRPPEVYRGWPFQVEVGIGYGGSITEPKLMRFANKVPLLYQQGDCAITKSAMEVDWRRYGIEADKLPTGPVVILVHICSVWVPFTSESKEAVSSYPIIIKEIKLALQECARKIGLYLGKKRRAGEQEEKRTMFQRYAIEVVEALHGLTNTPKEEIRKKLDVILEEKIEDLTAEIEALQDKDFRERLKKGQLKKQAEPDEEGDDDGE